MNHVFYGVMSEFYDDGTVKACILYGYGKEKPKNSFRRLPFADCYRDWYENENQAKLILDQCLKLQVKVPA